MQFSDLTVKILPGGCRRLTMPLTADLNPEVHLVKIIIPKGFETDFASIPQRFRGYISTKDTELAAVIHDYSRRHGELPTQADTINIPVSNELGDHIFYEILRWSGVGWIRARVLWMGVRIGSSSGGAREQK